MPDFQGRLIHEAASLFRLIDAIDELVFEQETGRAYTDASNELFAHVHDEAESSRRSINELIKTAQSSTDFQERYESDLIIKKDRWRTLHTYIKPAIDAHTLNIPGPLLTLAKENLRQISGINGAKIVALLTPELMYYHNTPRLPLAADLVFVEVPYSQGPGFFTNLTIYHEIGHWVYDQLRGAAEQRPAFAELAHTMETAFAAHVGANLPTPSNRSWAEDVLEAWTREVFCDTFAVRHLGPAFSFALIDVFSLIGLIEKDKVVEFDPKHPAAAIRFKEQLARLKADGWWELIENMPSGHISLINELSERSEYCFQIQDKNLAGFIEIFTDIVPAIQKLVVDLTPHCKGAADFNNWRGQIEESFLHGVVPSHLIGREWGKSPTPVSMINSAYCFYLTGLPNLMAKLEKQDPNSPEQRALWVGRLEAWTMKAIEDFHLMKAAMDS